jgi:hypothetical protein
MGKNGNGNFRIPEIILEVLPKFRSKRNETVTEKYENRIGRKNRNQKRKRFRPLRLFPEITIFICYFTDGKILNLN